MKKQKIFYKISTEKTYSYSLKKIGYDIRNAIHQQKELIEPRYMDTLDIETYTAELIATMNYLHDRQLKLILGDDD
ncbi:hypothetical protein DW595_05760 [Enterococcus faecalis]|nr:hypothetical protein [Enterococcus faecalis]